MLTITDSRDGGTIRLTLDGELDLSTHADLSAALEKAIMTAQAIEVDCARLKFCDSMGVQTFLFAHRRAQAGDVEMRLVGVRGLVLRVLTICGAMTILTAS